MKRAVTKPALIFALFLILWIPTLVLPFASASPPATSEIDFAALDAVIASQMSNTGCLVWRWLLLRVIRSLTFKVMAQPVGGDR